MFQGDAAVAAVVPVAAVAASVRRQLRGQKYELSNVRWHRCMSDASSASSHKCFSQYSASYAEAFHNFSGMFMFLARRLIYGADFVQHGHVAYSRCQFSACIVLPPASPLPSEKGQMRYALKVARREGNLPDQPKFCE